MKNKFLLIASIPIASMSSIALVTNCGSNPIIQDEKVEKIELSSTDDNLTVNQSLQINATITPEKMSKATLIWSVNNENIASISQTGLLNAKDVGDVVVRASWANDTNIYGEKTIHCIYPKYKNQVETNFGGKYAFNYGHITDSPNDTHIETFYINQGDKFVNNPNFGEAEMIYQCIRYKKKYPNKDVELALTSFHFSYMCGACVNKANADYGKMKQLKNEEYDDNGYIRISYLLVLAAKAGINVYSVGHIPAAYEPTLEDNMNFEKYFENHMNDYCDDGIHKVKDYLRFKRCKWPGYGDKAATDIMHLKNCVVSAYTDDQNIDHDAATYVTSSNLDAILDDGRGGLDTHQTGIIVSDHNAIARCFLNYTKILQNYCEKEDVVKFRQLIRTLNKSQIDTLSLNPNINVENQIVYLGSNIDNVFELYLTPFAGSPTTFDLKYNPYCKYINTLRQNDEKQKMCLTWMNPNFNDDSEFTKTLVQMISQSFEKCSSNNSKLILGFNTKDPANDFKNLIVGDNIGIKSIGELPSLHGGYHSKDLMIESCINGEKQYVTLWSTINFHMGANYYQSNSVLVIKENKTTHNSCYINLADFLTFGLINQKEIV